MEVGCSGKLPGLGSPSVQCPLSCLHVSSWLRAQQGPWSSIVRPDSERSQGPAWNFKSAFPLGTARPVCILELKELHSRLLWPRSRDQWPSEALHLWVCVCVCVPLPCPYFAGVLTRVREGAGRALSHRD